MGGFSLPKNFQKTLPYDLTNVRKIGIIETRRKEHQMYGLPDSVIIGTARRLNTLINQKPKERKMGMWDRMMDRLYLRYLDRKEAKRQREALAKKHGVSFSD
jgi:hypothetical protein